MTRIILFLLINALSLRILAQTNFQKSKDFQDGIVLYGEMVLPTFLSANYAQSVQQNRLEIPVGYGIGFRYVWLPLLLDAEIFFNGITVNDPNYQFAGQTTRYVGYNFSAAALVSPQSKYVSPYVGAGYQLSAVQTVAVSKSSSSSSSSSTNDEKILSGLNTSSPFWKVGLKVSMAVWGLSGEYRQSFEGSTFGHRTLSLMLTINLVNVRQ